MISNYSKEEIAELIEGNSKSKEMIISLLKIKSIETIFKLVSKVSYIQKSYIVKYLPIMSIDEEKKLVDSLSSGYYTDLIIRAQTNHMRDYIFGKVF